MQENFKQLFVQGPIGPALVAAVLEAQQAHTATGAHSMFLGQVRADTIAGQTVTAIEYTAYEAMAQERMQTICGELCAKYDLAGVQVRHSLGIVPAGALCLFVFTSSPRRAAAIAACGALVERIKAELPVWGRTLFADDSYQWKVNR